MIVNHFSALAGAKRMKISAICAMVMATPPMVFRPSCLAFFTTVVIGGLTIASITTACDGSFSIKTR